MNTHTMEFIERELEEEQARLHRWEEDIKVARGDLRQAEHKRDQIAEKIGALKETLGHGETTVTLNASTEEFIASAKRLKRTNLQRGLPGFLP